jgi:beta-lactamase class A
MDVAKKALLLAGWTAVGLTAVTLAVQLAWPSDRALPYMMAGSQSVGLMDRDDMAAHLRQLNEEAAVTVRTLSTQYPQSWHEVGITVAVDASVNRALSYPYSERIIPFSSLKKVRESRDTPLVTTADEEKLQAYAESIAEKDREASVNAAIKVVDGRVEVSPAQTGYKYDTEAIAEQLRYSTYKDRAVIALKPTLAKPWLNNRVAQGAANQAANILETELTLKAAGHSVKPTAKQIGTWLAFAEQKDNSAVEVAIDRKKIEEYLTHTLGAAVYRAPDVILVRLLDGSETSRTSGSAGRAIDLKKSSQLVIAGLEGNRSGTLELPTRKIEPGVRYDRNYTFTNKGLATLLRDWDQANPGIYSIVVKDLGSAGLQAAINPNRDFVTASTFKIFLAYAVLNKIDQGAISFNTKTDMGWTVDACMKEMIINSTNACATSLFNLVGWSYADNFVRNSGFSNTYLNNAITYDGEKHTTARDGANFLQRLNAEQLLSKSSTSYLLNLMKSQIYRGGIPAGVPGVTVANKVGFYGAYKHDVAIIYAPRGTYILSVMSIGGSDWQFRDLSQQVSQFFDR